jgi:hypothetical protein
VVASLPVPGGCHRIAFDYSGAERRIYVTNQVVGAVLCWREDTAFGFVSLPAIAVQGRDPEALAVLPDGRLMVGNRATLDLEVLDPNAAAGSSTVARIALGSLPFDLVVHGNEVLVPTFILVGPGGFNVVHRVALADFSLQGAALANAGTDYVDLVRAPAHLAVVAAGSGSLIVADSNLSEIARVDLAPGARRAVPQDGALALRQGEAPEVLVVDQFRETVRAVALGAVPPFTAGREIPLGHSRSVRLSGTGALTPQEEGERFFRSVEFFNGTAATPNPVTCQSCHIDGASHNIGTLRQSPPMWGMAQTAPYGSQGVTNDLLAVVRGAFNRHGVRGGSVPATADTLILSYFNGFAPPVSPFLEPDGSLSAQAQLGKQWFEGAGKCAVCHAAPVFIPLAPFPLTLSSGIGTGLAPINVPSLRGAWATAPYLHNGSALTLRDVLVGNPLDIHGQLAATATAAELDAVVAYLSTL